MPARRRRTGSENEQPFIIVDNTSWSQTQFPNFQSYNNGQGDFANVEEFVTESVEPEPVMTSRDRTNEFVNAIRSMQGRNIAKAVAVRDPRKAKVIQSHTEFMNIAKSIGKNIASTYTKLEKLTLRKYF